MENFFKKSKFITKIGSMLLIFTLLITGCSTNKASTSSQNNQTSDSITRLENKEELIIAAKQYDGSFDPCMGWGAYSNPLIQSKLMQVGAENKLVNDLATDYNVSEDGLVWTFHIRKDVTFHDGTLLTAKDVAFTFNNTKSLGSKIDLSNMVEAIAKDDTTVEFKMSKPCSPFLYITALLGIVPEHAYGSSDAYSKNPIGSGPLKFVQYDEGQQLILERNDNYYSDPVKFKKVTFLQMTTDAAYAAIQSGTIDIAVTNEALTQKPVKGYCIQGVETYDYRVISMPINKAGGTTKTGEPSGNDVTSDPAIRKALSMGINRSNIINNVLYGYGEPTFDMFSKFPWGIKDEVKELKDGDIEAAKKILDEAGWIEKDGVREKDGIRAEFTLMYGIVDLGRQAIAMSLSEEAKKLGIIINPVGLDWSEIEQKAKQDPMVLGGGQFNPMSITKLYESKYANEKGWSNVSSYSNNITDKHIKAAIESISEEEANKNWKQAQWDGTTGGSILGDMAYIPICYVNHIYFVREGLDIGTQIIHPHDHGLALTSNINQWDYNKK
ncbi:MAG: ABC transporter substrate-binding protein [Filifactoraceae bacterium]